MTTSDKHRRGAVKHNGMTARLYVALLVIVVQFGFMARAVTFQAPLLDHQAWRQADTAAIARNFFRERFNPLYPQVDQRGARSVGYVESGFELYALLVAGIARLAGDFYVEIGRALNSLLFIASALVLHGFLRRRYGETIALTGTFVYAFGFPLVLYIDRAFMNEPLLIFLSLACLASTQRYLESERAAWLMVLIVASTLIGMVKLPYLIVWAPVFGLFAERFRALAWRRWELYLMAASNLLFVGLWYSHAARLGALTGLSFGMTDKLFDAELVLSADFWAQLARRLVRDILGPVGIVLLIAGTLSARRRNRMAELYGLVGFVAYVLLVARGNDVHDYYQLALMPVACVLVPLGLVDIVQRITGETVGSEGSSRSVQVLVFALCLIALSTFVRSASFHSWYELESGQTELCRAGEDLLLEDDLLLFVGYNSPQLMFCMDRRGWLLAEHESNMENITQAWQDGATIIARPRGFDFPGLQAWVEQHGTVVFSNREWQVSRLVR